MAKIVEDEHGNYQIKAGKLGGVFVARAFPKPPAKTKGMIAEAAADSADAAIAALKTELDTRETVRRADRRFDEQANLSVPNEHEYLEALQQASLSNAQIAMLRAHAIAGEDGLTTGALARAADYKSLDTARTTYGKAGRALGEYLDIEVPKPSKVDGEGPIRVLAFGVAIDDGKVVWIMHPELRRAVQAAL